MATAADLVKSSLRLAGIIASGETPSSSEQSDSIDVLNDILEEWSNDGYILYEKTIEEFTFVPSQGLYTIGSGANFNTTRPMQILEALVKEASDDFETRIRIYNTQEWAEVGLKSTESELPVGVFYNSKFPNGELNFWPVPSVANTLILYSLKPLSSVVAATTLSYPPGYNKALKYTLATELAPEFGRPSNPKIEDVATKAKAAIQRSNFEPVYLSSDAAKLTNRGRYNILTGSYD